MRLGATLLSICLAAVPAAARPRFGPVHVVLRKPMIACMSPVEASDAQVMRRLSIAAPAWLDGDPAPDDCTVFPAGETFELAETQPGAAVKLIGHCVACSPADPVYFAPLQGGRAGVYLRLAP